MFTNEKVITVFHKTIDNKNRLPKWEKRLFFGVYWEKCTGQSEQKKGMGEADEILCIIPESSLTDCPPVEDDLIAVGDVENQGKTFTVMSVKYFLYGTEKVRHIEVRAK